MRRTIAALTLVLVFLATMGAGAFLPVKAEPRTIIVPDDYPTIAAAIENSDNNDNVFIRRGTYDGPINQTLTINKSIALVGEDTRNTILRLHPSQIQKNIFDWTYWVYSNPITIDANYVNVSGLTITSDGGLITAVGDSIRIADSTINHGVSVTGKNTQIIRNTVESGEVKLNGSRMIISQNTFLNLWSVAVSGANNYLTSNKIQNSSVSIVGTENLVFGNLVYGNSPIDTFMIEGTGCLVARNYLGEGLVFKGAANAAYANRILSGVSVLGANNIFVGNEGFSPYGIYLSGAWNSTFFHNNFVVGNLFNVAHENGAGLTVWDNGAEGNYWSDYHGSDLNSDGVGDITHVLHWHDPNQTSFFLEDGVYFQPQPMDDHPLMKPLDILSFTWNLPAWVTITLPNPLPMPTIEIPPLVPAALRPDRVTPIVKVLSPEKNSFVNNILSFTFTVSEPCQIEYGLDWQEKVVIQGNFTLKGLTAGPHFVSIYATDAAGNMGVSDTIHFTVTGETGTLQQSQLKTDTMADPSRWMIWVAVTSAVVAVVIVSAGLLLYNRKRLKEAGRA